MKKNVIDYLENHKSQSLALIIFVLLISIGVHIYNGYIVEKESSPSEINSIADPINNIRKGFPKNSNPVHGLKILELMNQYEELALDSVPDTLKLKEIKNKLRKLEPNEKN